MIWAIGVPPDPDFWLAVTTSRRLPSKGWWEIEPHLFLLHEFLSPRDPRFVGADDWGGMFGAKPLNLIEGWVRDGLLVSATHSGKVDVAPTGSPLRSSMRRSDEPGSGSLGGEPERTVVADPGTANDTSAAETRVQCSPEVRAVVEPWVAKKKADKVASMHLSFELLRSGQLEEAFAAVREFSCRSMWAMVMEGSWLIAPEAVTRNQLPLIFEGRPSILRGLDEDELNALKVACAMQRLWGVRARDWLPSDFRGVPQFGPEVAVRMLWYHTEHRESLTQSVQAGIKTSRIFSWNIKCCSECERLPQQLMPTGDIPELPHPLCTSPEGCHCQVVPGEFPSLNSALSILLPQIRMLLQANRNDE